MPITYPLLMPSSPGFRSITMRPRNVVASATSPFTGQKQVYAHSGQWWEAEMSLPPMTQSGRADEWASWLTALRGSYGTFLLGDSSRKLPRGVATQTGGGAYVAGAGQVGSTLSTSGWSASTASILKAGDYIQIQSPKNRLYKVLLDVNSDSSGNATFDIWPRLRESPTNSSYIITLYPKGTFRLLSNDVEWSVDYAKIYGISFSAVEDI